MVFKKDNCLGNNSNSISRRWKAGEIHLNRWGLLIEAYGFDKAMDIKKEWNRKRKGDKKRKIFYINSVIRKPWSDEEMCYLGANYTLMGTKEMADVLHRSTDYTQHMLKKLGLKRTVENRKAIQSRLHSEMIRHPHSEKTKKKISIANAGERNGNFGKRGSLNHKFKGRYMSSDGYVLLYSLNHPNKKNGSIREHRFVVEKKIGRFLKSSEIVHHINENKTDNHIENLMLFKNTQEHIKFHNKIRQFGFTNPISRQILQRWAGVISNSNRDEIMKIDNEFNCQMIK